MMLLERDNIEKLMEIIISVLVGVIFGVGLAISGMLRRSKILGFLTLNKHWDPALMFVLGGAVCTNLITFYFILKGQKPVYGEKFNVPTNSNIDSNLIIGSTVFGIGWGLSGLCPGPALTLIPVFSIQITVIFLCALALG